MVEVTYEVLKKIQGDVAHIKLHVEDHGQQFIAIREQLHNLHGEILWQERQGATFSHRLERIERRLNLSEG